MRQLFERTTPSWQAHVTNFPPNSEHGKHEAAMVQPMMLELHTRYRLDAWGVNTMEKVEPLLMQSNLTQPVSYHPKYAQKIWCGCFGLQNQNICGTKMEDN